VNVHISPKVDRPLTTGLHTVSDLFCDECQTEVGWFYHTAYEVSQKYKENKYILVENRIIKQAKGTENTSTLGSAHEQQGQTGTSLHTGTEDEHTQQTRVFSNDEEGDDDDDDDDDDDEDAEEDDLEGVGGGGSGSTSSGVNVHSPVLSAETMPFLHHPDLRRIRAARFFFSSQTEQSRP